MGNPAPHRARKRFGQNFLHDPGTIQRIVQAISPQPGDNLVEIGPGQGAITTELLSLVKRMHAIELDRDLLEPLARRCAALGELEIHNSDALKFDFTSLAEAERPLRVVGNLPYNISTPLLFHLLDQSARIRDMHFMLQKEVVERMGAEPGSKRYGRLTVMLQARAEVTPLFTIGPGAFRPPPKVDSAFVRLVPLTPLPYRIDDWDLFGRLVSQAFSQRRKTLRNSLGKLLTADAIEAAAIDPGCRAEQLSVAEFVKLANLARSN
ncbi:MAG: 16S rRNA (adenine(1518)-N(6)/adenine(1519)-N(6))-dimethyltransferase RsmA [gamma proteobacterium symbiont of Ctena orbiculata]|nr:16S rRNA (adenine(1518)-N(6)/adenine(1519)-N(6))-dimethyltransferase RsmA [Candidatus Thiodiazotropha taylori]MBT3064510.1 16S rRNA (adenine(1518)-N(6)/adenine(1519)-N(6))-dimethyltransferase RsmA [Candidatus Thiodiazotropha sp. (ex Lucina pensylvanica)]MBV2095050.1 16S rRNA (adenine(1518)-N(6)/adenine(1519)-N(6))-dimethyltransferase RsmA [Candidatus Thiodiazotropha sp. (ex Codakia orbicularis)]PUB76713.1 MAG: 16S rRNA (adenine(1518)-N(6)/adenine(1519)-N(6))-dimethyltransferase [gamma proteob